LVAYKNHTDISKIFIADDKKKQISNSEFIFSLLDHSSLFAARETQGVAVI